MRRRTSAARNVCDAALASTACVRFPGVSAPPWFIRRRIARMGHQPRASFQSPRFAQPATFMRLPYVEDPRGLDVAIVGVPYDGGTSYRPGARLAPREIRNQSSLIRSYNYFQKVAPFDRLNVADAGDVDAPPVSIEKCYEAVEVRVGAIADASVRPLVVGGDHSITLPV